jgi:hypothetical protein
MAKRTKFIVTRLDEKPTNVTYGTWCFMTQFDTLACAEAFVDRAKAPKQQLRIEPKED